MKVGIDLIRAHLSAPFVSATGAVEVRELLLLRLEDTAGHVAFGEAAPLESYDGVTIDDCRAALEDCRSILAESDGAGCSELLKQCRRAAVLPQAVAAVDLALWDLAGLRAGQPVWRLLGAGAASPVQVNYTIGAEDRAGAADEAAQARSAGFRCVKVKVGIGDDGGRVAAVRATTGPDLAIRLDANGAWTVPEADAALRALEPAGIELCEEAVTGLAETRELSALAAVPLAIDETAAAPGALDERVCEAVCLKIARCGGITGLLESARRARAASYEVYLASTLDGPLGIAAALHAAAALNPDRPSGLATLELFADRVESLAPRDGQIPVPASPGLGAGLARWYRAESSR